MKPNVFFGLIFTFKNTYILPSSNSFFSIFILISLHRSISNIFFCKQTSIFYYEIFVGLLHTEILPVLFSDRPHYSQFCYSPVEIAPDWSLVLDWDSSSWKEVHILAQISSRTLNTSISSELRQNTEI